MAAKKRMIKKGKESYKSVTYNVTLLNQSVKPSVILRSHHSDVKFTSFEASNLMLNACSKKCFLNLTFPTHSGRATVKGFQLHYYMEALIVFTEHGRPG